MHKNQVSELGLTMKNSVSHLDVQMLFVHWQMPVK